MTRSVVIVFQVVISEHQAVLKHFCFSNARILVALFEICVDTETSVGIEVVVCFLLVSEQALLA